MSYPQVNFQFTKEEDWYHPQLIDTYAHVTKKMKKETVDIFESIMS